MHPKRRDEGRAVTDNEVFVILMQVAREDPEVRGKLLAILRLEPESRRAALDPFLDTVRRVGAPKAFVEALSYLADDGLARKALEFIEKA